MALLEGGIGEKLLHEWSATIRLKLRAQARVERLREGGGGWRGGSVGYCLLRISFAKLSPPHHCRVFSMISLKPRRVILLFRLADQNVASRGRRADGYEGLLVYWRLLVS